MKKRLLKLFFLSGILITLLSACEYDYIVPTPPTPKPPADDTISYIQDVQPVFTAKCVSCHAGSTAPNLLVGQSYSALVPTFVTAGNPETSELYITCKPGGNMDAIAPITSTELNLVYRWIYAGAKNN
jgi:mono/diheme cytochrome c family protein